jgi:cell division protease FtsH
MKNWKKNLFVWVAIIGILMLVSAYMDGSGFNLDSETKNEISFSDFLNSVEKGEVSKIEIRSNEISGEYKNKEKFFTLSVNYPELIKELREKKVELKVLPLVSKTERVVSVIGNWLPFLIIIALSFYFMKGSGVGVGGNPFKFGKSKAKLLQSKGKLTFADVAGIDEVKEELKELVDFLKSPGKFTRIGAKIPRGCLLIGEPGTGKTLLAKAIAGEAEVPFFFISGSDFVEMFVGVGASRVRDMFDEAKFHAPCLIFIDEIDAVGRQRGVSYGGANDEREQTLNQLLVEMDGFEGNEGIVVVAATNRSDVLDKALLRPGRFDRQIYVSMPDYRGREEILKVHAKQIQMAGEVDLSVVAKATPGFSGAELANLLNESALLAARHNRKRVTNEDMEEAIDKVRMGLSKKNRVIKPEDRELTAYHEAGHAIVAMNLKNVDPIHKITIIPRGFAGGVTSFLPEDDKMYERKIQMLEDIMVAFGGRLAEEIIYGDDRITGGASSDIKYATKLAERMVTVYGFSNKLGPINYEKKLRDESRFQVEPCSDDVLNLINSEVKSIIETQKQKAKKLLLLKKKDLELLARGLLKYETLDKEQINKVLKDEIDVNFEKTKPNYKYTNFSIFNPFLSKKITDEVTKAKKDNKNDKINSIQSDSDDIKMIGNDEVKLLENKKE